MFLLDRFNLADMTNDSKLIINLRIVVVIALFFAATNGMAGRMKTVGAILWVTAIVWVLVRIVFKKANVLKRAMILSIGQFFVIYATGVYEGRLQELIGFFICSLIVSSLYVDEKIVIWQGVVQNVIIILSCVVFYEYAFGTTPISFVVKQLFVIGISTAMLVMTIKYAKDVIRYGQEQHERAEEMINENQETLEKTNALMEEQRKIIDRVFECSGEVSLSSDKVTVVSQNLNTGVSNQERALDNLSNSIMDISMRVQDVTEAANEGERVSNETSNIVKAGEENMHNMVNAMQELNEISTKINKVVSEIDNIAFQTNILALNASVEAARAGTAGKGFAVVANEVRNLATKSAASAKDTALLMEQITSSVEHGLKISNDAATAFAHVVEAEVKTQDTMKTIVDLSARQVQSVTDLSMCAVDIKEVVDKNRAIADECSGLSVELTNSSNSLAEVVSK